MQGKQKQKASLGARGAQGWCLRQLGAWANWRFHLWVLALLDPWMDPDREFPARD